MIYRSENHKFGMKNPWCLIVFCAVLCVSFVKPEIVRAESSVHYQMGKTANEDPGRHVIDIDVSAMDEAVMADYGNTSEFKISLTNTGKELLTNFEVSLEKQDGYELFCEEKGVRYRLLTRETSQEEAEKISDKTTTLPNTLTPGETITVYAVRLHECEAEANLDDEIFIVYTEETGQHKIPLSAVPESNQNEKTQEADPFTEGGKDISEILSDKMTESNQGEKEDKADIESNPDNEVKNDVQKETTNGKALISGNETAEKNPENMSNEETDITEGNPDNFICDIKNIERTKGCYMSNTFFASKDSQYIVHFSPESSVKELNYQIGAFSDTVSIENSFAVIKIPDNVSDNLEIFCTDQSQNKVVLCSEYVVNENIAPTIHYEKMEKDGNSYALVTIEEYGDIISGLMDCTVSMDGNFINASESSVAETINLFGEYEAISARQYTILLESGKTHNFEVIAKDYAGNTIEKSFSFKKEEKEIVNVVLPTSFNILVLPDEQKNQLYGEDIVLCNKSTFPVQVDVTSAQVQVDDVMQNNVIESQTNSGSDSSIQNKGFDLSLQLLQADKLTKSITLTEGNTENVASFVLSAKNSSTDFEAIQKSGVNEVNSPDYAVLNVRGTINQDMKDYWKNDDLHVKIVFRFNKLGERN